MPKASLMKAREATHKIDVLYMGFWNTPDGQAVLADLKKHFLPEKLSTDSAHTTAVKVGESNPVRYILRRIEDGMDGKPF